MLVQAYGPLDGCAFVIALRAASPQDRATGQLFITLADLIARSFPGMCLTGDQVMNGEEWLGHGLDGQPAQRGAPDQVGEVIRRMQPAE